MARRVRELSGIEPSVRRRRRAAARRLPGRGRGERAQYIEANLFRHQPSGDARKPTEVLRWLRVGYEEETRLDGIPAVLVLLLIFLLVLTLVLVSVAGRASRGLVRRRRGSLDASSTSLLDCLTRRFHTHLQVTGVEISLTLARVSLST